MRPLGKKKCLRGLAFLGFIPIKIETGLQTQQKALACQTAAIRLQRIYGVCDTWVEPRLWPPDSITEAHPAPTPSCPPQ